MKFITQNRKHWLFTSLFLFLAFNGLLAQTLSEKLGGVTTNFTIISGDDTLSLDKQIIVKRAKYKAEKNHQVHETFEGGYGGYGYGLGYGYQSFHLEFTSKAKVNRTTVYNGNRKPKWVCSFHCYDANGKQILEMFVPADRLKQGFSNQEADSFIYSLNLVGVPIVVLDKTTTIQIEWLYHTYKSKTKGKNK